MNVKHIGLSLLILLCLGIALAGWSRVRSVSQAASWSETIKKEEIPALIKKQIVQMKEELEKDTEQFPRLIRQLEDFTASCTDSSAIAVLHSMVAEMYQSYYQQNRWTVDRRTPISGYVPEDVREWTANLYTDKIREELQASLRPAVILQATAVSGYQELLADTANAEYIYPTLFDFLSQRAINIQPEEAYYQAWRQFRQGQPDQRAALFTELSYLEYKYAQRPYTKDILKEQSEALDSLLQLHRKENFSNEIRIAQVELLNRYHFSGISEDSVLTRQVEICTEGIRLFPDYARTSSLKNTLSDLQAPSFSMSNNNNVYPGGELKLSIQYKNLSNLTIRIYKSKRLPTDPIRYETEEREKDLGKLVKQVTVFLNSREAYLTEDTVITTTLHTPGLYECVVTPEKQGFRSQSTFSVSRLASVSRSIPGKLNSVYVTDYQSGRPLDKTAVIGYIYKDRKWLPQDTLYTSGNGIALFDVTKKWTHYRVCAQGDTASAITPLTNYMSYDTSGDKEQREVVLLTDRTLYRPGQTVYFKGIAYKRNKNVSSLLTRQAFTVTLRDANRKEVTRKEFTSSDYGSFEGEFTLPAGLLNGTFSFETTGGYAYFSVEEYKRPSFLLAIDPLKGEAAFGDLLQLTGTAKTFSGATLNNGSVEYRILRRPMLFRDYFGGSAEVQVAAGQAAIESDGRFAIPFIPRKEEGEGTFSFPTFYQYELIARLTDSKGETQEQQSFFAVGETGFILSIDLPSTMAKETAQATVKAQTASNEGNPTVSGDLLVYELKGKPGKEQKEGAIRIKASFTTGVPLGREIFSHLPSGAYRMKLEAKDSRNRTVKAQQDFVLYGADDARPPVFSTLWIAPGKTDFLPGEEIALTFGSSEKAYILYELFSSKKCLKREIFELNNENRTLHFLYPGETSEGLVASLSLIKDGKLTNRQMQIREKQPNRTLTIKPETFRDRLLPGSKETWKFKILNADSTGVPAELLAGLYDASLDQIKPFTWSFNPWIQPSFYLQAFSESVNLQNRYATTDSPSNYANLTVPAIGFYQLDWQGVLNMGYNAGSKIMVRGMTEKLAGTADLQTHSFIQQESDQVLKEETVIGNGSLRDASGATSSAQPQIRQNFNETAFFYPSLQTDADGSVAFTFTLPESNTTWKLQALVHTTDLKHGYLTKELISRKPLMVTPNLPRFLREGDEMSINTQLLNQSEDNLSGKVWIEWFDPATEQPIPGFGKEEQSFTLDKGKDSAFSWTVKVPEGIDLIGCRIVADSETASDGEQHLLPVISREIKMTESKPFYLTGQGDKTLVEPSVPAPYRLTFELASNPVWYAVQALPTLAAPTNPNVISWFASYYSQALASSIANRHPKIRQMITQWQAQGGSSETLLSNLQKNEELKNILLEETPWVLEAQNETEQKQRLALLFDLNRAESLQAAARQKILEQQRPDGSWGWFEGFNGNRSITLHILRGMAQLTELNAIEYNQEEREMQIRALQYLDREICKDYAQVKKAGAKANGGISPTQLDYLFVRSFYRDIPEDQETKTANRHYTTQAATGWKEASLYGKAQTALLLHRNGEKQTAQQILAWLRKTATVSEEMGMYWANNRKSTDFFFSPIDTHCLLLAVFHQLAPNRKDTDRLKQWLLTQKRTQDWNSVPGTENAIYALLLTGSDWLSENNVCTVDWRGKTYDSSKGEAGTGYFKQAIEVAPETASVQVLKIHKQGIAPAWGALYVQYNQPIAEVVRQGKDLSIDRKLFIEQVDGKGRKIVPLAPNASLKVGDRVVVRLTVRNNTALSYVHLKDLRPGCMEPTEQLSRTEFRDGVSYYRSPRDVSENFFFDRLPAGTFVLEYTADVSRAGRYSGGLSTIQCLYAPEYVAHSQGTEVTVNK